jgi:Na+-driven multidrug efflux pump
LRNSARLVFLSVAGFSALGVSIHAAIGLGLQVRLLSVLPALAFQVATATLVGDAIGRGQPGEAERIGQRSVVLLGGIMFVMCGFIAVFADPLARVFIEDKETAALAAQVLRWFALGQFFSSLTIAVQGTLAGAGDTKPVAWAMFVSQWLVLVPAAYILLVPCQLDPLGPLLSWAFAPLLAFVMLYLRFLGGKWKSIQV